MRRVCANHGCQLLVASYLPFTLHSPIGRYQSTQGNSPAKMEAGTLGEGSTAPPGVDQENPSAHQASEAPKTRIRSSAVKSVMERAASARRDIFDLWRTTSEQELSLTNCPTTTDEKQAAGDQARITGVAQILDEYRISVTTQRDEDICRGLGDALDRLLLLCVPFSSTVGTEQLEQILHVTGRQGRKLSVRTIQHLFSRANNYAEALAIFYSLRRCHFAMNMETYHAMMYSLQRLEEEGWAMRFHDDYIKSGGESLSEQALDFVLSGINNQLLPENKPWLGRIMFSEVNNAATERQARESFDELGKLWLNRYKEG
ncbi:unnamed protein product [Phytomonas sp. EM1]|nr:unnamed protein product [Phytomonas sp. EM1]|eukprot:CCW62279.1 unnamed protein product [Phytomonas sp. isolate EM1]